MGRPTPTAGDARELLPCRGACAWLDDPDWSPDGSSIVYSRTESRGTAGWGSLETVDVQTGRVHVLLAPRVRTFTAGARWSPDGSEIVFESVHKDGPGIGADVDGVTLKIVAADATRAGKALTQRRSLRSHRGLEPGRAEHRLPRAGDAGLGGTGPVRRPTGGGDAAAG